MPLLIMGAVFGVILVVRQSYMRKAGTEHNVTIVGDHEVVIVDVVLKGIGSPS